MKPNKTLAFLSYLLSIPGWLYVLLFRKKDKFAVYHAKQSMMLTMAAIVTPLVWAIIAWLIAWIALIGPLAGTALFSLAIATYIFLAAIWILGMVNALRAKTKPLPVVGGWAQKIPVGE